MNVNTNGKNFIKTWETGTSGSLSIDLLTVKDDGYGNLTVGYGHKVVSPDNLKAGDRITQTRANRLFTSDLSVIEAALNSHPKSTSFTQVMYNAMASLLFNVGTTPIKNTQNDLYKVMNESNTYRSPIPEASKSKVVTAFTYTKVNGVRQRGLVNRRNAELNVFLGTTNVTYISYS